MTNNQTNSDTSAPHPNLRVLVAEDSATQAAQLEDLLKRNNYDVRVAQNGRRGIEIAREWHPALIISDIVMPEMDGYGFCRAVKQEKTLQATPFMLLTSLSDPGDVIRGLECGADNFVVKPYEGRYLLSRVAFMLANRSLRDEEGSQMGVGIVFGGRKYFITSDRLQILNLLLSTYETAVNQNRQLLEMQKELRESNERLAEANKELEAFSYSVSHDLRAPLRAMAGFSKILAEDFKPDLPDDAVRYLGMIRDGAERMGRLIDDLLAFSRFSRQPIRRTTVDLEALCRDVMQDIGPATNGNRRIVKIAPLPKVSGDPSLLRQVVFNLLSNAVKYSSRRENATIVVGVQEPGDMDPVFFVQDNGAGFDLKYADKLFGVFQRLHSPKEFEGTGVGLAIVQRIIHRHGGKIWAEAEVNRGATFYFTLPTPPES